MNYQKRLILSFLFFSTLILSVQAQSVRPVISDIHAEAASTAGIRITWKVPAKAGISALLIFRNFQPIASTTAIAAIVPIAKLDPDTTVWIDTVKNYREYYYAVLAETKDGLYRIILPSINATVNGVHVKSPVQKTEKTAQTESAKEKTYPAGTLRETPLPYLNILENQTETPYPMSKSAITEAQGLTDSHPLSAEKKTKLPPYAFEEDMVSPPGGDEYLLFETLHRTFAQKKYAEAVTSLQNFLSVNRDKQVTSRACFYLGECQYFSYNYRGAVVTFLKVQDIYPILTKQWIDSALDLMNIPDQINKN